MLSKLRYVPTVLSFAILGPMQGQANHFVRYAAEHNEYSARRYQNEVKRLYGVLDKHLKDANTEYLVGNKC